jgi:uncharacterized protein YlxW (UPF0749 family)
MKRLVIFSVIILAVSFYSGVSLAANSDQLKQKPVNIDNGLKKQQADREKEGWRRQLKESQRELNNALDRWSTPGRN